MPRIAKLSPDMINKIAAGEVVERPASVIKELVENAIDAGAKRIDVTIEGGGSALIRVCDDGHGIARDDLELAVSSHATSKIATPEDLFEIGSLGFRGEALASVAAVSHLRLASRPADEPGAELLVDGGRMAGVRPAGLPPGTTIEVADLFFNVPARREFMRTERGELRAALLELKRQALARPEISFKATSAGSTLLDAPACDEPRERIAQLLGRELAEDMLAVPITEEKGVRVRGYTTPCDRSRGDSRQQYFFLNNRCVRDVTLLTAVKQAYANLLPPRRHPSLLLWLELDPTEVDVNVHPQKSEVRFRYDRHVFKLVRSAIQEALKQGGMVNKLELGRYAPMAASPLGSGPALALQPAPPRPMTAAIPFSAPAEGAIRVVAGSNGRFLQIHRRYILEQTEAGLRILDPHALHERILYEQILERIAAEPLESQRFLFPTIVELSPDAMIAAEERADAFGSLGFEITPFGPRAMAIHAAPRLLKAERVSEAFQRMLVKTEHELEEDDRGGILHDLAASLACRSAVRFGEALSDDAIAALLDQRTSVRRGHCCPHGRPTALALSLDELDRRFGRQGLTPRE